jgi:hypothetical protein
MVASHLVIGDEMVISVTDVSPFCDDLCDVMELNSICDERCWSWMEPHFCHNLPSIMVANGAVNGVCVVRRSDLVTDVSMF